MNNKIKLAVAGAVLSAASIANAGIVIPAGDWTIDINGNVNAFYTRANVDKNDVITGTVGMNEDANGEDTQQGMTTGLLPSWLGFTGTTRQNDVDVSFTISFQTATIFTCPSVTRVTIGFGPRSYGGMPRASHKAWRARSLNNNSDMPG
jgi:hypothetical protein